MKIFFLAPSYLSLYVPILEELRNQGHDVTFFEDGFPMTLGWTNSRKWKMFTLSRNPYKVFWRRFFMNRKRHIFNESYDLLLCINGVSFHPMFLNKLKKQNKNIFSTLYVWDTSNYYDYFRHQKEFDKVLTFDIDDSKKYKVDLLPFYWVPNKDKEITSNNDYILSIVGSNHDGRLEIVEKVARQLDLEKTTYCFKIYQAPNESPFCLDKPLTVEQTMDIMMRSRCILDTDRPTQTGTTPRIIWALALGKKIISTNTNLKRMPFYDERLINIIDRENPIIDYNFLLSETNEIPERITEQIDMLRIDRWVRQLLP